MLPSRTRIALVSSINLVAASPVPAGAVWGRRRSFTLGGGGSGDGDGDVLVVLSGIGIILGIVDVDVVGPPLALTGM